jgi:YHS domain-containing protein
MGLRKRVTACEASAGDQRFPRFGKSGTLRLRSRKDIDVDSDQKLTDLGIQYIPGSKIPSKISVMKSLRFRNTARVAALAIVFGINAVGASDQHTQTVVENSAHTWTNVLAQNAVSQERGNKRAKVNVDSRGVILKGYDSVAYIKEGKPVKGAPEFKSSYQGATYLFASVEDKAAFDKDPPKYAPQYGGFCAYGISLGVLGDVEDSPAAFVVYNGKLYICGNAVALERFRDDIDSNIEKADRQWRRISKL